MLATISMNDYTINSPEGITIGLFSALSTGSLLGLGVSGFLKTNDLYLSMADPSQHPLIFSGILIGGAYSTYNVIKDSIKPSKLEQKTLVSS